jgi:hypothetical protein
MATELEITKRNFISDYNNYYKIEKIAIEDCKFLTFVNLLDEMDIINPPVLSRENGTFKKRSWSLLGYFCESSLKTNEEDEREEKNDDLDKEVDDILTEKKIDFNWEYSLFNGFFSETPEVNKANKQDILKYIDETVRYIENTFSNNLIPDFSEARNLQDELIKQRNNDSLDRIDIIIVTDLLIEQDDLETSVYIQSIDLTCRIYYWDLKKWNDLKRSKTKRLPVNIDFKEKEYCLYNIDYIEKQTNNKLTYFLSIFPGQLISDIYDYNKTSVLENNVRVFLSANQKANAAIRKTIKHDPLKFFSYNNGISATAESVQIEKGKIIKINDFQIVNGGQTTASIHYSNKKDKVSLDGVFVSVKITALKKDDDYSKTVSNISQAANTQTAVKTSDFYANDPLLIGIERISLKTPAINSLNNNIYYFFERMSGQYNVTKNSRGTIKYIKIWEESHPKVFSFNKIDVARWFNMMYELPHISAAGAEKQFDDFMKNKNFVKPEINEGRYKTLIGFGLLFQRIYKLCGKANGKSYPSLIIDPVTGTHSPVALSTAIYTMTFIHMVTDGRIDYWSIFNFQDDICDSLISKERIETKYDSLLENIIIMIWHQIAKYGGAAAQEQTKKKSCWEYVKSNINLNYEIKKQLDDLLIPVVEKDKRNSLFQDDEDKIYFESLDILFKNNANIFQLISNIANNQSEYVKEKMLLNNQIKKIISKNQILTKKRVQETINFYNKLISNGFLFNENIENNFFIITFDLNMIYDNIFKNRKLFYNTCEEFILANEVDFEKNNSLYEEVIEIIEKYDREYGLSLNDFEKLNDACKLLIQNNL